MISVVWKKCFKCSYVWMSSEDKNNQKCPSCGRFNQRILNVEQELRKQ
jgi:rubrerythrin